MVKFITSLLYRSPKILAYNVCNFSYLSKTFHEQFFSGLHLFQDELASRNETIEKCAITAEQNPAITRLDTQLEQRNPDNVNFLKNEEGFIVVYTDGACLNNGREDARAGVGVWFNHNHPLNISAAAQGIPTCNNAEIQAARLALSQAHLADIKKVSIYTDSKFLVNCITNWMEKWKKNKWKRSGGGVVKNKEELIKLDEVISKMEEVRWHFVQGHKGIVGNYMADKLARKGAELYVLRESDLSN